MKRCPQKSDGKRRECKLVAGFGIKKRCGHFVCGGAFLCFDDCDYKLGLVNFLSRTGPFGNSSGQASARFGHFV